MFAPCTAPCASSVPAQIQACCFSWSWEYQLTPHSRTSLWRSSLSIVSRHATDTPWLSPKSSCTLWLYTHTCHPGSDVFQSSGFGGVCLALHINLSLLYLLVGSRHQVFLNSTAQAVRHYLSPNPASPSLRPSLTLTLTHRFIPQPL